MKLLLKLLTMRFLNLFPFVRNALGSDTPLSEDLMNKVNQTKKRIPVLRDLRTEALKERHWKQVGTIFIVK